MSFATISLYIYLVLFIFIAYYLVAWIYVKMGKYVFDYFLVWAFFPYVFFNLRYLKTNQELMSNKDHIAVVLCNNYMPERILSYRDDIPKLIKYFKKNNWPYKIYINADNKTLKSVINDLKATMVYILGHGQRHGVKVGPDEVVYYCDFTRSPKKKFIAQLHCNHYGGKSLVEYISKNSIKSFVTDKKINGFEISKFIDKVTKGEFHGAP